MDIQPSFSDSSLHLNFVCTMSQLKCCPISVSHVILPVHVLVSSGAGACSTHVTSISYGATAISHHQSVMEVADAAIL
jgi:hypothetical protein